MSEDFEKELRDRMKAHAAELDRTASPAPPLWTLMAARRTPEPRPGRTTFRLGLAVAGVAVLACALVAGQLLFGLQWSRPGIEPSEPSASASASVPAWPSAIAVYSPAPATPTPLATSLPTWLPELPTSTGGFITLEPTMQDGGVIWSPDGRHFAVPDGDSSGNVYIFDKAGVWVGEAPGWEAAWASDDSLIVLPYDPTAENGLAAYVATVGFNDVSTMRALPGKYTQIVANGRGTVALESAQGYAIWLNGSLLSEVECGCSPLAVSADGTLVALENAGLTVAKTYNGQSVQTWPNVGFGAHPRASFSPDGQNLAVSDVVGSLNTLVVLNVSDGRRRDFLAGHFVYNGTWTTNAQLFAGDDVGGWWNVRIDGSSPTRSELPSWSQAGVASSTGSVAAVNDAGTTLLIEKSGKTTSLVLPSPAPALLYWSPDGTGLIVTCESGQVILAHP